MTTPTPTETPAATPSAPGVLDVAARRVDTAMERADLLDAGSRTVAHDLKAAVEAFHREGLLRVVRRLKEDPRGKELLFELVDDPVVYALLVMHGIVRADPATLAQRALDDVRPYLTSHGGDVELVSVELPVARVRLSGACSGCSQSATTLREVVERALVAGVPGLHQVEVVPAEPDQVVIPLGSLGLRWTPGPQLEDLADGAVTLWRPGGPPEAGRVADDAHAVALVRVGDAVAAYRNACAHMGFSLEKAMVDGEGGVLTCPWHGYKYQALTGECVSAMDKRLEAYPARVDGGRVWLRLSS